MKHKTIVKCIYIYIYIYIYEFITCSNVSIFTNTLLLFEVYMPTYTLGSQCKKVV